MERLVGTISRGVRAPIIRQGDDLAQIVVDSVLAASKSEGFSLHDRDVVAVTEAVVARAQGNYAHIDQIAADVRAKLGGETVGVLFPILSRNRFSVCLKGIARGAKKIVLMLSFPADEVGNHLIDEDLLDEKGVNPYSDTLTEAQYRALFGKVLHPFTGVDYVEFYSELIRENGAEVEIVLSNNPKTILQYTDKVLCCDIHTRRRTKRILQNAGASVVLGLDDILTQPVDGSGCNPSYGLLGSNKATEETVKLFPKDCDQFVARVAASLKEQTGKNIEVMVYGDGAFNPGLEGTPNEVKLKYLADNNFAHLSGDALKDAISAYIRNKDADLKGQMVSQGTTPRRLTDLIGSLADLTSGSGDKGTPIVLIQGYFDNYTK